MRPYSLMRIRGSGKRNPLKISLYNFSYLSTNLKNESPAVRKYLIIFPISGWTQIKFQLNSNYS